MVTKRVKQMVAEANAEVETISVVQAKKTIGEAGTVFIDVREPDEHAAGHIPGAVHVPRGLLEFVADPASPLHRPELGSGARLIVYCASGGRSALAAKTLQDMGIGGAANLLGGFAAWRNKGGPVAA